MIKIDEMKQNLIRETAKVTQTDMKDRTLQKNSKTMTKIT